MAVSLLKTKLNISVNLSELRMDRTEGLVQRRRQPKVEENHDVNDDDRDEEEERVSCPERSYCDLHFRN